MNGIRWLQRWYYTLRPLKCEQWWFRFYHPIKRLWFTQSFIPESARAAAQQFPAIDCSQLAVAHNVQPSEFSFSFLNIRHTFPQTIDWDYNGHGLLWAYHLNYFDWLEDDNIPSVQRMDMLKQYAMQYSALHIGKASYPSSRRLANCIRFLSIHRSTDNSIYECLYKDAQRLAAFPERHLLGNHYWENALALLASAVFFHQQSLFSKARLWILRALKEQILPGGAHIELSPSYHCLLLQRLLMCLKLYKESRRFTDSHLEQKMQEGAAMMLGWLQQISFSDGSQPALNDVAPEKLPSLQQLINAGKELGITDSNIPLLESGYRKIQCGPWELVMDVANIQPSYQPGHAHADALTFCLHCQGLPIVVDTGTSTYQANATRTAERSTSAHNTVSVRGLNSSDTWKAFRVGKRAEVNILGEGTSSLHASHDGYKTQGIVTERKWTWSEDGIVVTDELKGSDSVGSLHLHFAPGARVEQIDNCLFRYGIVYIRIDSAQKLSLHPGKVGVEFNHQQTADILEATFQNIIVTHFTV